MASSPSPGGVKWELESVYKVWKPLSPQPLPGVTLSTGPRFTLWWASGPSQAILLKTSLLTLLKRLPVMRGLPCHHCGSERFSLVLFQNPLDVPGSLSMAGSWLCVVLVHVGSDSVSLHAFPWEGIPEPQCMGLVLA